MVALGVYFVLMHLSPLQQLTDSVIRSSGVMIL